MTRRGPIQISITQEEILEDLSWSGRPPGRWFDHPTGHIELLLSSIERASPGPAAAGAARTATPGRHGTA